MIGIRTFCLLFAVAAAGRSAPKKKPEPSKIASEKITHARPNNEFIDWKRYRNFVARVPSGSISRAARSTYDSRFLSVVLQCFRVSRVYTIHLCGCSERQDGSPDKKTGAKALAKSITQEAEDMTEGQCMDWYDGCKSTVLVTLSFVRYVLDAKRGILNRGSWLCDRRYQIGTRIALCEQRQM